jgi:hypothetical protein
MSMNWKGALAAGAVLGAGVLAACSDSATAPSARPALVPKSSFAVGDVTNNTPVVGTLKICKAGNVGGTFVVADIGDGIGGTGTPKSLQSPITVANGQCKIAVENLGNSTANQGDFYSVTENAAANTVQVLTSCVGLEGAIACNNNYFVNNVHGVVLTFTNTFTPPPPPRCTYTKGWYQSKHAVDGEDRDIIAGVEGLTVADQYKIFNATPGKLGDVEIDGPNSLLNLYQQLLAALNNLNNNEDGGPTAVDNAIDAAQDGTSITAGLTISTTLTKEEIGELTATLSAFNEGSYEGFAHCDDEILVVN